MLEQDRSHGLISLTWTQGRDGIVGRAPTGEMIFVFNLDGRPLSDFLHINRSPYHIRTGTCVNCAGASGDHEPLCIVPTLESMRGSP